MNRDISESDWKKWKVLRLRCIDEFCHETFAKVRTLDATDEAIHDKHRKLYRLINKRDREIVELFDPLRRSTAIMQLITLYRADRITDDDIAQFSEELCTFLKDLKTL